MSATLTILVMAVVTYSPRLLGFLLANYKVSNFWKEFLNYVPIAVFAALIIPALASTLDQLDSRVPAAILTGLVIWKYKNLSLGIAVGMISFWIFRAIL